MIFCCNFWRRNQFPKFYRDTVYLMKYMDDHAFLTDEDLEFFVRRLNKQIMKDKPKGNSARIYYRGISDDEKGYLYLTNGTGDTDIARMALHKIKGVRTYGFENEAAFTISKMDERLIPVEASVFGD